MRQSQPRSHDLEQALVAVRLGAPQQRMAGGTGPTHAPPGRHPHPNRDTLHRWSQTSAVPAGQMAAQAAGGAVPPWRLNELCKPGVWGSGLEAAPTRAIASSPYHATTDPTVKQAAVVLCSSHSERSQGPLRHGHHYRYWLQKASVARGARCNVRCAAMLTTFTPSPSRAWPSEQPHPPRDGRNLSASRSPTTANTQAGSRHTDG